MSTKAAAVPTLPVPVKCDITQHEIAALKTTFNLADAHTHQSQSPTQRGIVENLPALWYGAEGQTQYASEQEFIDAFYRFHGQLRALERRNEIYLVYAASIGMHITATYMLKHRMKVGLIEPCFDNLHDLMKHMQVPMFPLAERLLADPATVYSSLEQHAMGLDAIVLVDPNNPTGFSVLASDASSFREIVRFCVDHDKLLVIDLCFASFILASGQKRVDVYEILEDSGVRYVAMEDTGKTWPLQDAKCATITCSRDINNDIYQILTSVLLNVSPFILKLVTRYILDSGADDFASVREVLDINRKAAQTALAGTMLKYFEPMIPTSVAWFQIKDPNIDADALQAYLLERDVYVLSGKYFYWHNPDQGQRYIRIALARRPELFAQAMTVMREALERHGG
jgi:aspartate/methionine/tyrosine aminotransferase